MLKSCTWESDELRSVYNMWVGEEIVRLGELKQVPASIWKGLSTVMVGELLDRPGKGSTNLDWWEVGWKSRSFKRLKGIGGG